MLFAIGIGINLFVILQLIRKDKLIHLPTRIGLAIALVWAIRFLLLYLKFEPWIMNYPIFLVIDQYLLLLDSLLLWMYARSMLQPLDFNIRTVLHFLPFIVLLSLGIISAILYPEEIVKEFKNSVEAMLNSEPNTRPGVIVIIFITLFISIFYFIRSVLEVRRYNTALKDNFSNIENLKINWVLSFQRVWILLFVVPLVLYLLNYILPTLDITIMSGVLILSFLALSIFFNSNLLIQSYTSTKNVAKNTRSKIEAKADFQDEKLLSHLYNLLEKEKYYQDEQLSLEQLASYLEMKPTELTDLIKKSKYANFYDLVNSFRVEAVKRLLSDTSEQIIVIAYQCGFNSKSAFNKIFKEKTEKTPREYRLSLK